MGERPGKFRIGIIGRKRGCKGKHRRLRRSGMLWAPVTNMVLLGSSLPATSTFPVCCTTFRSGSGLGFLGNTWKTCVKFHPHPNPTGAVRITHSIRHLSNPQITTSQRHLLMDPSATKQERHSCHSVLQLATGSSPRLGLCVFT